MNTHSRPPPPPPPKGRVMIKAETKTKNKELIKKYLDRIVLPKCGTMEIKFQDDRIVYAGLLQKERL